MAHVRAVVIFVLLLCMSTPGAADDFPSALRQLQALRRSSRRASRSASISVAPLTQRSSLIGTSLPVPAVHVR
jgi:hypothetical protein